MEQISLPETLQEKQASKNTVANHVSALDAFWLDDTMEKKASFDDIEVDIQLNPDEAKNLLFKMAAENTMLLGQARVKLARTEDTLIKRASILHTDPLAAEKLSYLGVGGLEKFASESPKNGRIFWPGDLDLAKEVVELTKTASELKKEIIRMEDLEKRASLFKEALVGAIASGAGKALGYLATRPFKWGLMNPFNKAVKGVKTSFNAGGGFKDIKGGATNVGKESFNKAKKIGGGAMAVGMAGFDASMYQPKDASNIYHQMRNVKPYGV